MNNSIPSTDITNSELVYGQNVIYNQTEKREFHFIVNGKNNSAWTKLKFQGERCPGGKCTLAKVVEKETETTERLWSDPKSWTSGKVPVAGENVEI